MGSEGIVPHILNLSAP